MTLKYILRALRKTPVFTLGAIATIALSAGAASAIFSVVHAVLLRQLPYRSAEQVFWLWSDQPGRDRTPFNVPDFIDYRDSARTLSGLAGYFAYSANLSDQAAAERVQGLRATGNLFDVLGTRPSSGNRFGSTARRTPSSACSTPASRRRSATSIWCCRSPPIAIRGAARATRSTSFMARYV